MTGQFPHFLWQNPSALETIYPQRANKLREFLLTYREADLVAQHADLEKEARKALVRQELEPYQAELDACDPQQLLERAIDYLDHSPRLFKPWVKYAIVHFSGMRYESAHGSWAEPRTLIQILIKRKLFDPALLGGIEPEALSDEQVQAALEELGPNGKSPAPAWAWLAIVLHTNLRLSYVSAANAFILGEGGQLKIPGYQQAQLAGEPFSRALQEWLKPALTSWRDKQFSDFSLVVLRAVCNEISEHVHHIRLHVRAGGGLNARPNWYLVFERSDNKQAPTSVRLEKPKSETKKKPANPLDFSDEALLPLPEDDVAYLRRPLNEKFFKHGASILWLGWVKSRPSEWQMTFPLREYDFFRDAASAKTWKYSITQVTTDTGTYKTVTRSEQLEKDKKKEMSKKDKEKERLNPTPGANVQWLRWTHEAVVVDVVDLLDGRTVLTFETEPVTGLNRRSLGGLCRPGGGDPYWHVFVGYAREKPLEAAHQGFLTAMTDSALLTAAAPPEAVPGGLEGMPLLPEVPASEENARRARSQYKELPRSQRQAVALYCQGLSKKLIAKRMGLTQAKVGELLQKAAKRVGLPRPLSLPLYFNGIDFGKWNVLKESSY